MAKHESVYLKKLKFNPTLLKTFIAKYFTNLRLIILITLVIIVAGIYSFINLPRNLNPEIKIPIIIVTTVLPGANPQDIESLVTIPIEDAVRSVPGIDKTTSNARESVSITTVQFKSGIDADKAKTDVQSKVDAVTDLPTDAEKPNVQKLDFENQPIWTFNLVGKTDDRASLFRFGEKLKKDLGNITTISRVDITGLDEREVQIVLKPEVITAYGTNPQLLMGAVKAAVNAFPAGNVRTSDSTFSLSINQAIASVDDVRNIRVNVPSAAAAGGPAPTVSVSLGDIASVVEKSKPDQGQSYLSTTKGGVHQSITFNVFRASNINIDRANKDAVEVVERNLGEQQGKFEVFTVINTADLIDEQFSDLQRDLTITILLVSLLLFVFLGARQALVALFSTPLTFLITFIVMNITGIALSFIATFSLLLSLGLLVDDSIVVISAMTAYHRSGKFTPLQTALLVWKDFLIAVFTTTITTVFAFVPLLLSSGIIGEFIKPIPIVVSSTLMASFFVAIFLIMPFMVFLLKPSLPHRVAILIRVLILVVILGMFAIFLPKNNFILEIIIFMVFLFVTYEIRGNIAEKARTRLSGLKKYRGYLSTGFISFNYLEGYYTRAMTKILNSPAASKKIIIMVIIFSVFSYLLVPFNFVKTEFFPKTDEDYLYVAVSLPAGTNLTKSKEEGFRVFQMLNETPEVKYITLQQGVNYDPMGGIAPTSQNDFLYSLVLKDKNERKLSSLEIAQRIRDLTHDYTAGKISIIEVSGGPPAGADLQINLYGPDYAVLDRYATKVEDFLKKQQGITNVDRRVKSGTSKLVFVPDDQKIAQAGLTRDSVGFTLRIFASGFKASSIKLDPESTATQDITIRLGSGPQNAEDITSLNVGNMSGESFPLSSLGTLKLATNPTIITREDGKRAQTVFAGVTKGYNVTEKNKQLEDYAKALDLPAGYSWATGGVNEENNKSVQSILMAMVLSFILILSTMVLQFNSFRRALIVLAVIPLSISGVFIFFGLSQTPLSFPALIGILALFGIVVKNSILVVDKILINIDSGLSFKESIIDGAASRLEPIALTSMATILGLLPITLSNALWRGLGGAIIAGLTFSGTIMLFFIPVVYYLIYKPQTKKTTLRQKKARR